MQKHGGTLAPSTRPTVQPTHDRTLHAGSTHTPDVFFCQIQWRPKQTQKNTGKTKQSKHHPHKKTEKNTTKQTNEQTNTKKHCMFDSKCCCAWFSFWNCRYGSLRLKLHYPLAQDFRYLIGPCHFQPPGSTVKAEKFQMKHMRISGTLSQDTQRKHN